MGCDGFGARRRLTAAGIGAVLLATVAGARAAPFTIEQVLGAPYPTSLIAAPAGTAAAWVFTTKGVRNIWVADGADGAKARAITSFTQDDGFDVGDLAWSADARTIAFLRGQTLEDDAPANVISSPIGPVSREVWTVSVTGGAPRKVGAGHTPSFAPDGGLLVFLDKHQMLGVEPGGPVAPRSLVTDLGTIRSVAWSPDGKRIAFVSHRKTHSLIGIYDRATKSITWLAPSLDFDSNPVFSPDGAKVAFVRVPTQKVRAFVARRSGEPWSIWVADMGTGAGHRVWVADAGAGSVFHPTLSPQNLFWTADNGLAFPWEKTGWLLPYLIDATGGPARALASGTFETAYITLSPDCHRLVYASNQEDIDRLHVWSVDPARGGPVPVSRDRDIEAFPQVASNGTMFALQSGARTPLHPVVLRQGQWQSLASATDSRDFPSADLVTPQSVTFRASDGQVTHGQLFLPTGGRTDRHPAVLFFHGGPPRQMLLGFHYMSAYNWMYAYNQYLASQGYVVLSVNYRGGIGYGLDYREAKNFGPDGGSELNDLLGAVTYMKGRADVDAKHMGLYGLSYGGLMTGLGLARAWNAFAAGVDAAGVYNWASMLATLGAPIDDPALNKRAFASSPVATIDRWRSPVLVVQSDDDRNVPSQQSTELVQDLNAHGIPHEVLMFPNEVHDFTRYASWIRFFTATDAYLARYLKPSAR